MHMAKANTHSTDRIIYHTSTNHAEFLEWHSPMAAPKQLCNIKPAVYPSFANICCSSAQSSSEDLSCADSCAALCAASSAASNAVFALLPSCAATEAASCAASKTIFAQLPSCAAKCAASCAASHSVDNVTRTV